MRCWIFPALIQSRLSYQQQQCIKERQDRTHLTHTSQSAVISPEYVNDSHRSVFFDRNLNFSIIFTGDAVCCTIFSEFDSSPLKSDSVHVNVNHTAFNTRSLARVRRIWCVLAGEWHFRAPADICQTTMYNLPIEASVWVRLRIACRNIRRDYSCSTKRDRGLGDGQRWALKISKGKIILHELWHERHLNLSDTWDNFASRTTSSWTSFCTRFTS